MANVVLPECFKNVPNTPGQLKDSLVSYCDQQPNCSATNNNSKFPTTKNQIASLFFNDDLKTFDLQKWLYETCQTVFGPYDNNKFDVDNAVDDFFNDQLYLRLDSRVCIDEKLGFRAESDIASGCTVLREEPVMFIVKKNFLNAYCATCRQSGAQHSIPCSMCNEVVYCSIECSKRDREHQLECGLVSVIQLELGSAAYQAYRLLILIGADELIRLEESPQEEFCLSNTKTTMLRKEALLLFAKTQCKLRAHIEQHKSARTATELASALFLVGMYAYKHPKGSQISPEKFQQLCAIMALEISKVPRNIYGVYGGSEVISEFQCLIGSRIGHACVANAEWHFNGSHLLLVTTKSIKVGEEICINYGVFPKSLFIDRQKLLSFYFITCACSLCCEEIRFNFAFRCPTCSGAVPYDAYSNYYNDQCMLCKNRYEYIDKMFGMQQECRNLINIIESTPVLEEKQWSLIETQFNELFDFIYLDNEEILALISVLCGEFIRTKRFYQAIEYYESLANDYAIHLCLSPSPCNKNQKSMHKFSSKIVTLVNRLTPYERYQLWSEVFVTFLEQVADSDSTKNSITQPLYSYIQVAKVVIKQFNSLWNLFQVISPRAMLENVVCENQSKLVSSSSSSAVEIKSEKNENNSNVRLLKKKPIYVKELMKRFKKVYEVLKKDSMY